MVVCAQISADGFEFVIVCGAAEHKMTYLVRKLRNGYDHVERLLSISSWRAVAAPLRLRPGDSIVLTRPPVWSEDGTSRMGLTVERVQHTQLEATAVAAAANTLTCGQRFAEDSQPGSSGGRGPRAQASAERMRIVLGRTTCPYVLQLTHAQAAALMPPDDQVPIQTQLLCTISESRHETAMQYKYLRHAARGSTGRRMLVMRSNGSGSPCILHMLV